MDAAPPELPIIGVTENLEIGSTYEKVIAPASSQEDLIQRLYLFAMSETSIARRADLASYEESLAEIVLTILDHCRQRLDPSVSLDSPEALQATIELLQGIRLIPIEDGDSSRPGFRALLEKEAKKTAQSDYRERQGTIDPEVLRDLLEDRAATGRQDRDDSGGVRLSKVDLTSYREDMADLFAHIRSEMIDFAVHSTPATKLRRLAMACALWNWIESQEGFGLSIQFLKNILQSATPSEIVYRFRKLQELSGAFSPTSQRLPLPAKVRLDSDKSCSNDFRDLIGALISACEAARSREDLLKAKLREKLEDT